MRRPVFLLRSILEKKQEALDEKLFEEFKTRANFFLTRKWVFKIHTEKAPKQVMFKGKNLPFVSNVKRIVTFSIEYVLNKNLPVEVIY